MLAPREATLVGKHFAAKVAGPILPDTRAQRTTRRGKNEAGDLGGNNFSNKRCGNAATCCEMCAPRRARTVLVSCKTSAAGTLQTAPRAMTAQEFHNGDLTKIELPTVAI